MDILLSVAWLLIGAGVYCAIRARRLDNELRRSLPPSIELRPRERALDRAPKESHAGLLPALERELQAGQQAMLDAVLPLRWRLSSYSPAQTALLERMWRLMTAALVLVMLGLSLIAVVAEWLP